MPRTLRTRAELEQEITAARAELILAEDGSDTQAIREARARVDAALDAWSQRRDTT